MKDVGEMILEWKHHRAEVEAKREARKVYMDYLYKRNTYVMDNILKWEKQGRVSKEEVNKFFLSEDPEYLPGTINLMGNPDKEWQHIK